MGNFGLHKMVSNLDVLTYDFFVFIMVQNRYFQYKLYWNLEFGSCPGLATCGPDLSHDAGQ